MRKFVKQFMNVRRVYQFRHIPMGWRDSNPQRPEPR